MSHRRQTPEEHYIKTHRRENGKGEFAQRAARTAAERAKNIASATAAAGILGGLGLGRFARLFKKRRPREGENGQG